jgi:hypothetical protein
MQSAKLLLNGNETSDSVQWAHQSSIRFIRFKFSSSGRLARRPFHTTSRQTSVTFSASVYSSFLNIPDGSLL